MLILPDSFGALLPLTLSGAVTIPIIYWYYRILPVGRNISPVTGKEIKSALVWTAVIISAGIFLNFIAIRLPLEAWSAGFNSASNTLNDGGAILRILSTVIIIPFLEELLFRGIILGQLSAWFNGQLAVVCSAVIFGALHFNVIQFTYAVALGILLGELYISSRRLGFCYLAHALTNLLVILIFSGL